MNILFLEESNHLSYSKNPLTIGGWIIPRNKIRKINNEIKKIKRKHGIKSLTELKWTKIGKSKIEAYKELVNYALKNENMKLRVLVAKRPENMRLQYHDWYTRLHYSLINSSPFLINGIISDKKGSGNEQSLDNTIEMVLGISAEGYMESQESQIIQLSDIFLGAIASSWDKDLASIYKKEIIDLISSQIKINSSTSLFSNQEKYNIFYWGYK